MLTKLFQTQRVYKQLIMLAADSILLICAVWASYAMRFSTWQPELKDGVYLLYLAPIISIPIFIKLGLYRAIIRFIGGQAMLATLWGVIISTLVLSSVTLIFQLQGVPRSAFLIYGGTAFLFIGGSRYFIRRLYYHLHHQPKQKIPVIIYGAGTSGTQLASSLFLSPEYHPVCFVDNAQHLHNTAIQHLRIYSPEKLPELVSKHKIQQVLLATPSATPKDRKRIIRELETLPVHVKSIPGLYDLMTGKHSIEQLREIEIDELLGRDSVKPDEGLMKRYIHTKNVMVTGAGGSIGSEMCRQIIKISPAKLVLFEASEFALYQIEKELNEFCILNEITLNIIPVLGSVQDYAQVANTIAQHKIETIYHAAAYKHVPLVEHNPIQGIRNNTFGTYQTAKAASDLGVSRFVLISTDKAVRPTNIMGASKRMAELVLQALATKHSKTTFAMVRFGNVLGSSGSVVPVFRKQIKNREDLTVTHPDIIRYFMTIPEAAQLVIQAGAMADGGEVFLLDMGEPVKIVDLAKRMIRLSGLEVKDSETPDGDIAIQFTGLRPGEKLYEELLIEDNASPTHHTRIFQAKEQHLDWDTMRSVLHELDVICDNGDEQKLDEILKKYVSGYKRNNNPSTSNLSSTNNVIDLTKHKQTV